jgi:primosomal protein N'
MLVEVFPARNNMFPLTYLSDEDLSIGDVIIVPFRNKEILAIVSKIIEKTDLKNVRNITKNLSVNIGSKTIEYYKKAADYYLSEIGSIIKIALPLDFHKMKSKKKRGRPALSQQNHDVSSDNIIAVPTDRGIRARARAEAAAIALHKFFSVIFQAHTRTTKWVKSSLVYFLSTFIIGVN